jgi:hypothetical protein
MPRPPTPAEKVKLKKTFPKLDVDKVIVSGEATSDYNCIAWTLGITNSWIWPGEKEADFDKLYKGQGFVRSTDGPIAAWGTGQDKMTHGCITGSGHGARWESKIGEEIRIQHGLTELEGAAYGKVRFFYASRVSAVSSDRNITVVQLLQSARSEGALLERLTNELRVVPKAMHAEFEKRYAAWQQTWTRGDIAISSDPRAVRNSPEFLDLCALGVEIVPLLLRRIVESADHRALQVYDALQLNDALRVESFSDHRVIGGEQYRALVTAQRWLSR